MQSQVLKPRDMAVYLERTWGITVPGFSGEHVRAHRFVLSAASFCSEALLRNSGA